MTRPAAALLLALLLATSAVGASSASFDPKTDRETFLLSRSRTGGLPNGPSRNGVFSQDRHLASYAAYESNASNIVSGDTNRVSDVFVVTRARPYDSSGPPWRIGSVSLASRGLGGAPANGPS